MQRYNRKFSELNKQNLLTSLPKHTFPPDLHSYQCQLIIDTYEQLQNIIEVPYLQFTNPNTSHQFVVQVDDYNQPNSALSILQIDDTQVDKLIVELKESIQIILITHVKGFIKQQMQIQVLQTVDGDLQYPSDQDIGMNILEIDSQNSRQFDNQSDSDVAVDLTKQNADRVKAQLIHLFSNLSNCKKKLKEIRLALKKIGFNVPQNRLRALIEDICVVDKVKGYVIKSQFMDEQTKKKLASQEEKLHEQQLKHKQLKSTKKRTKTAKKQKSTAISSALTSRQEDSKELQSVKLTRQEGIRIKKQIQIQRFEQGLPPLTIQQFTAELKRRALILRKSNK